MEKVFLFLVIILVVIVAALFILFDKWYSELKSESDEVKSRLVQCRKDYVSIANKLSKLNKDHERRGVSCK